MNDSSRKRNSWVDNARFILITLVVIGHAIEPLRAGSSLMKFLYTVIYIFHMPCFIVLSGFIAKKVRDAKKYLIHMILIYLVFQTIQILLDAYLHQSAVITFTYTTPKWGLWFLMALVIWYLLARGISNFRAPLLMSILVGLGVGYETSIGGYLSLSRILVFFPYYIVGYQWNLVEILHKVKGIRYLRGILLGIITIVTVIIYVNIKEINYVWLFGNSTYEKLGFEQWGVLIRLIVYGVSVLYSLCFLSFVPEKSYRWSRYGMNTLGIYVFHILIFKILRVTSFYTYMDTSAGELIVVIGSIVLTLLLGHNSISRCIKVINEAIRKILINEEMLRKE